MFVGEIFDPFAKVKKYFTVRADDFVTDNWLFALHRRWSYVVAVTFLLVACTYAVVLDQKQLTACFGPKTKTFPEDFINEWCYLRGTYIVYEYLTKKVGIEVPHPGIGQDRDRYGRDIPNLTRIYQTLPVFYPIILTIQFVCFRASKFLWLGLEGGRLKSLLSGLGSAVVFDPNVVDEADGAVEEANKNSLAKVKKRINEVAKYMADSPMTFHRQYALRFIFCEVYNLLSLIFQFFLIHLFLNQRYLTFGHDAVQYLISDEKQGENATVNPFTVIFPKVAKCILSKYGPSGEIEDHEAICILPWNNIAEKLFFIWWFWLITLGVLSVIGLIYRLVVVFCPKARFFLLSLRTMGSGVDSQQLMDFCFKGSYGDWFVLSLAQKNLDPWVFATLVNDLDMELKEFARRKDH